MSQQTSGTSAEPNRPRSASPLNLQALVDCISKNLIPRMPNIFEHLAKANAGAMKEAFFGDQFARNVPDWFSPLTRDIFDNLDAWRSNLEERQRIFKLAHPTMSLEAVAAPVTSLSQPDASTASSTPNPPAWPDSIGASPMDFGARTRTETKVPVSVAQVDDGTYTFCLKCDGTTFADVFNVLYDESHQPPPKISMLDIVRHFEAGLWRSIAYQVQLDCEGRAQTINNEVKLFGPIQVNEKPQGRMPRSFPEDFFYEYLPSSIVVDDASHSSLARLCAAFKASHPNILATERKHRHTATLKFARKLFFSHKLVIKVDSLTSASPAESPSSSSATMPATASKELRPTLMERRFCRFLAWSYSPSRRIYPFIPKKLVDIACDKMDASCIGVHSLMKKVSAGFAHFSNTVKDVPHGVLLWGPPGTGKTHIVSLITQHMDVYPVCPDLASGDFNRPYQGLSEAMVNDIRERALTVPWQLVSLAIDEIDGLAPSRDGAQSSGNKTDLLSVVLSIVGGNRNTLNLLLLGSTNRFDKMDEAFRRRLPLKYFVGRPNYRSRMDWILWRMMVDKLPFGLVWDRPITAASASVASPLAPLQATFGLDGEEEDEELIQLRKEDEQVRSQLGVKMEAPRRDLMTPKDAIQRGKELMNEKGNEAMSEVVKMLASLTTNFSNDAMRRLLSDFAVYRIDRTLNNFKDPIPISEVTHFALETARAERIYLGNTLVPELLKEVHNLRIRLGSPPSSPSDSESQIQHLSMLIPDVDRLENLKRLLIDLHTQPSADSASSPSGIIPQVHCLFSNLRSAKLLRSFVQNAVPTSTVTPTLQPPIAGPSETLDPTASTSQVQALDVVKYFQTLGILNQQKFVRSQWKKHLSDLKAGFGADWIANIPNGKLLVTESTKLCDAIDSLVSCAKFVLNCNNTVADLLSSNPQPHVCMDALKSLAEHHPASKKLHDGLSSASPVDRPTPKQLLQHRVNLTNHSRDIISYMITLASSKTAHKPFVTRYGLRASQTESGLSLQDVLAYCINFGDKFEVDVVNLVDSEALVAAERLTPEQAETYLSTLLEESREYESSLTILNLSSVAGLTKSYESATAGTVLRSIAMDRRDSSLDGMKYTYSIHRPAALEKMLNWFYGKDDATKHWVVAVSDDPHLSSRLRAKFSTFEWPLTTEEDAIIKKEKGDERTCYRCRLQYKESENKDDSCTGHRGTPALRRPGANSAPPVDLDKFPWNKVVDLQTLEETLNGPKQNNENMFDAQVSFWTCCRKSLYDTCLFHQKHAVSAEEAKAQKDAAQTAKAKNSKAAPSQGH